MSITFEEEVKALRRIHNAIKDLPTHEQVRLIQHTLERVESADRRNKPALKGEPEA